MLAPHTRSRPVHRFSHFRSSRATHHHRSYPYLDEATAYPTSSHFAPGGAGSHLAYVALAQSLLSQAQAQVEKILAHLETGILEGTDEPFLIYLSCYQVLQANHDPRAEEVLSSAYNLLQEQAARIDDKELRRMFLENIAAHREIAEIFEREDRALDRVG